MIARERQSFADSWLDKEKKKKKKKASKDKHYAFTVSNTFLLVFRKISHSSISFFADLGRWAE